MIRKDLFSASEQSCQECSGSQYFLENLQERVICSDFNKTREISQADRGDERNSILSAFTASMIDAMFLSAAIKE